MGVLRICKSRYPLNPRYHHSTFLSPHCKTLPSSSLLPASDSPYFAKSSSGNPSFDPFISSIASKAHLSCLSSCGCCSSIGFNRTSSIPNASSWSCQRKLLSFSSSNNTAGTWAEDRGSEANGFCMPSADISEIIDVIKIDGSDMESRLDAVGSKLSKPSIIEILRVLNVTKVPAIRFFEWVRDVHPCHCRNANVCSLMVDNCGRLGDYNTMRSLLMDLQAAQICLSDQAFGFLPLLSSTKEEAQKSIQGIISVLNEVGGSCRNSGIHSLIGLLCSMNSFDLAKFVLKIMEKKVSYYNILVRSMCGRGMFEDARSVIEEMWRINCDPDARAYNCLISSFCKQGSIDEACSVFEEMLSRSCRPDELTFEILIYFACRYGRSDDAIKFYNRMVAGGIHPIIRTHYAFIRGYFYAQQFDEAYRYVVDTAAEHPWSAEEIYSLLAGLHLKDGDLLVAYNLLIEMIQKGLRPKHALFLKLSRRLCKTGKEGYATNLRKKYFSFKLKLRQHTR